MQVLIFVATALTVYGIETVAPPSIFLLCATAVATALTVYGIETRQDRYHSQKYL